jgi:hypothetical protein
VNEYRVVLIREWHGKRMVISPSATESVLNLSSPSRCDFGRGNYGIRTFGSPSPELLSPVGWSHEQLHDRKNTIDS